MARWPSQVFPLGEQQRATSSQLLLQVQPLMGELPGTDRNGINGSDRSDFGPIEGVTPKSCLRVDRGQIRVDSQAWLGVRYEALQLGMTRVATSFAPQHSLGQQRLAPQRNQTLRIEVLGVQ